jgi:hypothetical protein
MLPIGKELDFKNRQWIEFETVQMKDDPEKSRDSQCILRAYP